MTDRTCVRALVYLMELRVFFSSRRRHTRLQGDWSSDVCSSDLQLMVVGNSHKHQLAELAMPQVRQEIRDTNELLCSAGTRSEERRVGEEGRSRWGPDH